MKIIKCALQGALLKGIWRIFYYYIESCNIVHDFTYHKNPLRGWWLYGLRKVAFEGMCMLPWANFVSYGLDSLGSAFCFIGLFFIGVLSLNT
eukprot:c50584_g1_i1 orf=663-938(+)